jgi:hypothetical protein
MAQDTIANSPRKAIFGGIIDGPRIGPAALAYLGDQTSQADTAIRRVLSDVIRDSRLSREEICARMSDLAGWRVTPSMLNSWTAPGRRSSRFPALLVDSFCRATGDNSLKRLLLGMELCGVLQLGEIVSRLLGEKCKALQIVRSGRQPRNGRDGGAAAVHEHA